MIIVTTPVNDALPENKSLFICSYRYREASQRVFKVLSEFSLFVERASIDEAYIDLTNAVNDHISSNHNPITETDLPNTFVQGYSDQSSKGNFVYIYTQRKRLHWQSIWYGTSAFSHSHTGFSRLAVYTKLMI